jgi:ATP-binding cassette subfamily F protein 3
VVLVSHDRYLLEACADRLWLVADGTVKPFDGDIEEYARLVLSKSRDEERVEPRPAAAAAEPPKAAAQKRRDGGQARRKLAAAEEKVEKFTQLLARVDDALAHPEAFSRNAQEAARLASQREELARALALAEEQWLELAAEAERARQSGVL